MYPQKAIRILASMVLIKSCAGFPIRPTEPIEKKVEILESDDMSPAMELDAVEVLSRTVNEDFVEPCQILRDYFMEKYTEYTWHCINYNSYSIYRAKSIDLKVGKNKYALFATGSPTC